MESEAIREWLDNTVKAGYGAKFATAFEEVGFDDTSDLLTMDDELMAELERELRSAGAKSVHLKIMKAAISSIVAPAAATRANLSAAAPAETPLAPGVLALRAKRAASR